MISLMERYNDQQLNADTRLGDLQMLSYLQESVRGNSALHQIADDDIYRMGRGEPPLSYVEYCSLLISKAELLDSSITATRRSVNMHSIDATASSEADTADDDEEYFTYLVHEAQRKKSGHLDGETWTNLPPETRRAWRNMDETSRKATVDALSSQVAPEKRQINHHQVEDPSESDAVDHDPPSEESSEARLVNQATSSSKTAKQSSKAGTSLSDAHPADPRKMMSQKAGTKAQKAGTKTRQVTNVRHVLSAHRNQAPLEAQVEDRHESDDESTQSSGYDDLPPLEERDQDLSSSSSGSDDEATPVHWFLDDSESDSDHEEPASSSIVPTQDRNINHSNVLDASIDGPSLNDTSSGGKVAPLQNSGGGQVAPSQNLMSLDTMAGALGDGRNIYSVSALEARDFHDDYWDSLIPTECFEDPDAYDYDGDTSDGDSDTEPDFRQGD